MNRFNIVVKKDMIVEERKFSDELQNDFESIYGELETIYIYKFKLPILGEFNISSIHVLNNNKDTLLVFLNKDKEYSFSKKNNITKYSGEELFEKIKKIENGIYFKNKNNVVEKSSYDFQLKEYYFENKL